MEQLVHVCLCYSTFGVVNSLPLIRLCGFLYVIAPTKGFIIHLSCPRIKICVLFPSRSGNQSVFNICEPCWGLKGSCHILSSSNISEERSPLSRNIRSKKLRFCVHAVQ